MADNVPQPGATLVQKLLVTTALGYGLHQSWPLIQSGGFGPEWGLYAWGAGALACGLGALAVLSDLLALAQRAARIFRALRPKRSAASASWLTKRQACKAGLGDSQGLFLGILEGLPLFIPNAVHGLLCSPARKGKTTGFVMGTLCHDIGMSRVVADMKGELAVQTARLIAEEQGQAVLVLNPAHKFGLGNAAYNPLQIILDDLQFAPEDAIADAWSLAFQLVPPAPGGDRDPFWPNGTRKQLVFVVIALCVLREEVEANLPRAFAVLADNREFSRLLLEARGSDALGGELYNLATNVASTWKDNKKHFESFREGAVQALVAFGPSGRLAPSMTHCDFRFADLKRQKMTLFLVCDYSRMDVFAPWLGLLIWAALKELVRSDDATPVQFILDEFTNYRLPGLPNALTALGGYGVRCWMVVQELEEVARAYGREALATILSQTDVKQFFGVASFDTARLVSQLLGEEEITTESYGMGATPGDMPSLSLGRARSPLLTPDQVRRLPDDEQILFIRNLPPARAMKAGYHEIEPWRMQVENNPLHSGERYLGKLKLRLRGGHAKATRVGTRAIKREGRPFLRPLLAALSGTIPLKPLLVVGSIAFVVLSYGWPHLLWEYTRSGSWCRYVSLPVVSQPFETHGTGHCPLIQWKK
ncbi:type IV secretory system conjugative DNA transfer family protein [uncultured Ruegeria sp.]|uniref:type IV secretory system conjugative DNA transfer family protein n=1 Tax=uncultured Ruegeria sp. TaxID=259304 RepID=UPI00261CACD8|nr:type IV secretory system conjugative DNA transfer family protein [uncultured Ruegeria sp.]